LEKDISQRQRERKRHLAEAQRRGVVIRNLIVFLFRFSFYDNISFIKKSYRTKALRLCVPAPLREVFFVLQPLREVFFVLQPLRGLLGKIFIGYL
jgi:hypothetical protein